MQRVQRVQRVDDHTYAPCAPFAPYAPSAPSHERLRQSASQEAKSHEGVPGRRFLDPKVLARIDDLELVARFVVEGFISGLHRSPHLGFSTDFAEHRQYMPGDDIRHMDWRLYARTDRLYLKQYEADTNANFLAILDVSASMGYGTQRPVEAAVREVPRRLPRVLLAPPARSRRVRVGGLGHRRLRPVLGQAPEPGAARARSRRAARARVAGDAAAQGVGKPASEEHHAHPVRPLRAGGQDSRRARAAAGRRARPRRYAPARSGGTELHLRRRGNVRGPRERRADSGRSRAPAHPLHGADSRPHRGGHQAARRRDASTT